MSLGAVVAGLAGAVGLLYLSVFLLSHRPRPASSSELVYVTTTATRGQESGPHKLPSLADDATTEVSVVVPCYNESTRLADMLDEAVPYLEKRYPGAWEILLVDDGSTDNTVAVALAWAHDHGLKPGQLRITKMARNRGKGGAVVHGVLHASGKYILFADADGASQFSDIAQLKKAVGTQTLAVAVGSRAHLVDTDVVVRRTFLRNFLMWGLHTLVYVFGIRSIRDTQCGFKLFTRAAAAAIFPFMHTERWIFDVEILLIALRKHIPVYEIPISWHEVAGSKIDLARDSMLMAVDLVVIRFAYLLGIYTDT